uniref:RNA-dependent RNA polymerase n=1 Tax=Mutum virus TaxID=2814230 RepID=A0A896IH39_9VIRU|nr:RNA-dependent RNA polymerase [Mutum virus]QSC42386.1 RNA-dependent RNA polymerase [Mutum virus]QSC42389.1 RNA-dependent RNA polymerase [Mutum virus]QSC42392.1 RNA-dependent RNA polymerase [Mutum virus]
MSLYDVYNALSGTIHRDAIASPIASQLTPALEHSLRLFPFSLTKVAHSFLAKHGINVPPNGYRTHPHPFHKTLENNLLMVSLPFIIKERCTVYFMKPEKFEKIRKINPNFCHLRNAHLTTRDLTRYPTPDVSPVDTPLAFFHDSLHYWNFSQMSHFFFHNPTIHSVYASIVVPPELHLSDKPSGSFYPEFYRYYSEGQDLHYILENSSDHYIQPVACLNWLKYHTVHGPKTFYIEVLSSCASTHLLLITTKKPAFISPSINFETPQCVELPNPVNVSIPLRDRLVPKKAYDNAFVYVRAVRTLRATDPAGFVRTQMTKDEYSWVTSAAWDLLARFVAETYQSRPNIEYIHDLDFFQRLCLWYRRTSNSRNLILSLLSSIPPFILRHLVRSKVRILSTPFSLREALRSGVSISSCIKHWISQTFPFFHSAWPCHVTRIYPYPMIQTFHAFLLRHPVLTTLSFLAGGALCAYQTLSSCIHYFRSLHTPNVVYKRYSDYFHNGLFSLSIQRSSTTCFLSYQPFGDLQASSFIPPPDSAEPKIPPVTSRPLSLGSTTAAPKPPIDPPPQQSSTSSAASNQAIDHSLAKTFVRAPEPFHLPTSLPTIPEETADCASTTFDYTPSTSRPDTPPLRDYPHFDYSKAKSPEPRQIIMDLPNPSNLPDPARPYSAVPPPPSYDSKSTRNVPDPKLDAPPPLLCDSSASGPVLPWYTINVQPPDPTTSFHCRKRSDPQIPEMPKLNCLITAVADLTSLSPSSVWHTLAQSMPNSLLINEETTTLGLSTDHLAALSYLLHYRFKVHSTGYPSFLLGPSDGTRVFDIYHTPGHWQSTPSLSGSGLKPHIPRLDPEFESALLSFTFRSGPDECVLPFERFHTHHTNVQRAKVLCSNLKNRFDGVLRDVLHKPELFANYDNVVDFSPSRRVRLCHLSGFAGCGKSRPIISFFRGSPLTNDLRVAVPNCDLRSHWKEQLRLPKHSNWRVSTWETSLTKNSRILIIDEIYKMPPGYLDLICTLDPTIQYVILLGDPLQGSYHSTNPDSSLKTLTPETTYLRQYIDFYCAWSYRSPKNIAKLFSITSLSSEPGAIHYSRSFQHNLPILTASENSAKTLVSAGHQCQTIASSQGLSFPYIGIHIDSALFRVSPNLTLVAFTRHKKSITLLGDITSTRKKYAFNPVLSALIDQTSLPLSFWPELNGIHILSKPLTHRAPRLVGSAPIPTKSAITPDSTHDVVRPDSILNLSGPDLIPNLPTTHLPETRRPLHFELDSAACPDPSPTTAYFGPDSFEPVYPGVDSLQLFALFSDPRDPFDLEILYRDEWSRQFPLLEEYKEGSQCASLIAAWHQPSKDPTLLKASIPKRLRFRENDLSYQPNQNEILLGHLLFDAWCSLHLYNPNATLPFDPILFAECINDNEFHQLSSKTKAVIMNNADRSDPDWRYSFVRIFAKSQHKVNENSLFGGWKACQTLALMHDAVILILGPVKKYQRHLRNVDRPKHIFVYATHTPQQLSDWCKANFSVDEEICVCNDYTAFDQSQRGEAVVFEILKMNHDGIPKTFQEFHFHLKTNVHSQFGPLTSMRLTGEPGTYDDNTDYNIAVLACRFNLASHSFAVSGDDSFIVGVPSENPLWSAVEPLLHVQFKIEETTFPLFCGYLVGKQGAIRSPRALFAKLYIAYNDDSLDEKMASYISEFAVGHCLGDSFWRLIPPDAAIYQCACFDFFCRFAPRHLKDALKIGEPDDSLLARVADQIQKFQYFLWYLLPSSVRRAIRATRPVKSRFSDDLKFLSSRN